METNFLEILLLACFFAVVLVGIYTIYLYDRFIKLIKILEEQKNKIAQQQRLLLSYKNFYEKKETSKEVKKNQ